MSIAAIIVGIDGWEQYTLPLVESIQRHEPAARIVVVDNASQVAYPRYNAFGEPYVMRVERCCYSKAINAGQAKVDGADWYIVLSNDVLCTGPFAHLLEAYGEGDVLGPLLKEAHGFPYLEGWAVAIPRRVWDAVGGWDEAYQGSDYEDVDFSTTAREHGFGLIEDPALPFVHLDQRQRYGIVPDFAAKNAHNRELFLRKHAAVTA